jgi:chemotaxis family two-component system sensor kinase Cph1
MGKIDLTACDREPIHIPGAVQPHGALLVLRRDDLRIEQAGGDCDRFCGAPAAALIGQPFSAIAGQGARPAFDTCSEEPTYLGSLHTAAGAEIDVVAHLMGEKLIVELEAVPAKRRTGAEFARTVEAIGERLAAAKTLPHLFDVAVAQFRALTGFDRVMIYQFLPDGPGTVVAEAKVDELATYLHHRFPASDIPQQARALYLRNLVRVIPDAGYRPADLVVEDPGPLALDMTNCHLRSVSPVHLQYLRNMGVVASASVSIVRDGKLWGLISCHHRAPKPLSFDDRSLCRLLGVSLSQQVSNLEEAEVYRARLRARAGEDELIGLLGRGPLVENELASHAADFRRAIDANGFAIRHGRAVFTTGRCPDEAQILALSDWLLERPGGAAFAAVELAQAYVPASDFPQVAAGLLAATASTIDPLQLLWFRAEQVEVIEWAGNPHKAVDATGPAGVLTPRKSFELWSETVRGRSEAWSPIEVETAERIARGVADLQKNQNLVRLNEALNHALLERDSQLTHKDVLLREGDHRIQNSLQILGSMLTLQLRETPDPSVRGQLEEALSRVHAVSAVHRRLYRTDQPQSVDVDIYVQELMNDIGNSLGVAWAKALRVHSVPCSVPAEAAMSVGLVVTELVLNAAKYAYGGEPGVIDINVDGGADRLRVMIRDYGGGITHDRPQGAGFGSKLMASLVRRLGGELRRANASPGLSVTLDIPLRSLPHASSEGLG